MEDKYRFTLITIDDELLGDSGIGRHHIFFRKIIIRVNEVLGGYYFDKSKDVIRLSLVINCEDTTLGYHFFQGPKRTRNYVFGLDYKSLVENVDFENQFYFQLETIFKLFMDEAGMSVDKKSEIINEIKILYEECFNKY